MAPQGGYACPLSELQTFLCHNFRRSSHHCRNLNTSDIFCYHFIGLHVAVSVSWHMSQFYPYKALGVHLTVVSASKELSLSMFLRFYIMPVLAFCTNLFTDEWKVEIQCRKISVMYYRIIPPDC